MSDTRHVLFCISSDPFPEDFLQHLEKESREPLLVFEVRSISSGTAKPGFPYTFHVSSVKHGTFPEGSLPLHSWGGSGATPTVAISNLLRGVMTSYGYEPFMKMSP